MSINLYNIKLWAKMLKGDSVHHVNQTMGEFFDKNELKGYFNNLTEKVTKDPDDSLNKKTLPIDHEPNGDFLFPVGIFQYGLGSYDLFLKTGDKKYLDQFKLCADWTLNTQEENGAWNNFFFRHPKYPYGAMCQGEAASLLVRAYKEFKDERYLLFAKKALDFMLLPVEEGGTTKYEQNDIILLEYTHLEPVLNGWIFAAFGLFDYHLASGDEKYKTIFDNTINAIKKRIGLFDNGYWSMYDLGGKITSPFYHKLHIAQMEALYIVTKDDVFFVKKKQWREYINSKYCYVRAFITKAFQKIRE